MTDQRPTRDKCSCPCHTGLVIMHVIGCCVPDKTKPTLAEMLVSLAKAAGL